MSNIKYQDIFDYYQKRLEHRFISVEKMRKKIKLSIVMSLIGIMLSPIIIFFHGIMVQLYFKSNPNFSDEFLNKLSHTPMSIAGIIVFMVAILNFIVINQKIETYKAEYCKNILSQLFEYMFPECEYIPERGVEREDLLKSQFGADEVEEFNSSNLIILKKFGDMLGALAFVDGIVSQGDTDSTRSISGVLLKIGGFSLDLGNTLIVSNNLKRELFQDNSGLHAIKTNNSRFNAEFTLFSENKAINLNDFNIDVIDTFSHYVDFFQRAIILRFSNDSVYLTVQMDSKLFLPTIWKSSIDFEKFGEFEELALIKDSLVKFGASEGLVKMA